MRMQYVTLEREANMFFNYMPASPNIKTLQLG